MHLITIGWLYVVLAMSIAEATSTQGSVLGAVFTFLLYGVLPLGIVLYLMGAPARRKARMAAAQAEMRAEQQALIDPDGGSHPAGDPVAPEGEKT